MNIEPKEVELIKMKNIVKTLHDNLELKEKEVQKLNTDNKLLLQARNCTEINKHLPSCDAIRSVNFSALKNLRFENSAGLSNQF